MRRSLEVSRVVIHPLYNSVVNSYYIALLELASQLNFNDPATQPICLTVDPCLSENNATAAIFGCGRPGDIIFTAGFGLAGRDLKIITPTLSKERLLLQDVSACKQVFKFARAGISDSTLCAGFQQMPDRTPPSCLA